ncbi:hypothetical protein IMSAGC011_03512 [Lachnospiraceae bacterium]|nr:hypothetical protein IMSAGC011_03512 [Lachnospiraceae bacterium]
MIIRENYKITGSFYQEALQYAEQSKAFTSNRHDFHAGGLENKKKKMFEGKLGEKAVKLFFLDNKIQFLEDHTGYDARDEYDFLLVNQTERLKVDVKTRTEAFHRRTLEMVEQAKSHPKDIFISVRLFRETNSVKLIGWYTFQDMIQKNQIENLGYLDNYVMYDSDLRPISDLERFILHRFKEEIPTL